MDMMVQHFGAPAPVPLIPDSAPFTPEQRAWLNGFLAGLYGGAQQAAPAAPPAAAPEDFPWHDPALDLPERLALAEGKPASRRMMAAMAQLDCGQCGYVCKTYAEALASGAETSLSLCQPGGKGTRDALKALVADAKPAPAAPAAAPAGPVREPARVLLSERLSGEGSGKDVRRIVLDLSGTSLAYEPGDSLGVAVRNDPVLVDHLCAALHVTDEATREALSTRHDIARPLDRTTDLLAGAATDHEEAKALRRLSDGEEGILDGFDLLDLLRAFPSARPPVADLLASLPSLKPRLYSIASSPLAVPGRVELCVGVVRETRRGRTREGVASTHLSFRADVVPAHVQASHFRLPARAETPVIMVGPGTGIAPFRAFLQHRAAQGIKGRTWLFFGDRHLATDFLFQGDIAAWQGDGTLERLSLAWSRDGAAKDYVQDHMLRHAADLWRWLRDGAHFYVCGDASRMAKDVDAALRTVAMQEGGMDADAARQWVVALARQNRYQRDVY